MLLAPRKIFSGVKVLSESQSGLYDKKSQIQKKSWHESFDSAMSLPHRGDAYHVEFPQDLDDSTIVAFKTKREQEINIGRDYKFDPMEVGECRIVQGKDNDRGIKDGEIVFIRQGPFNLLPIIEEYERQNRELHRGRQKPIMEGKHGLSERELRKREKSLINAHI